MNHSPAPWSVHPYTEAVGELHSCSTFMAASVYVGSGETLIAEFKHYSPANGYPSPTLAEMRANARLAIAAPELLEALETSIRFAEQWVGANEGSMLADARDAMLSKARAAIAKAKGMK